MLKKKNKTMHPKSDSNGDESPKLSIKKKKLRILHKDKANIEKSGGTKSRSNTQYRELLDNIYDAVIITDADASIIEVNKRAVEFFEFKPEDIIGMNILDVVPDADETFLNKLRQMPDSRYALIETRCKRRNASFFPAEIAVKALGGKGNNLSFFIRNITKRKDTEMRLRVVNNAVRNALTAIIITDTSGVIEYSNPAGLKMLDIEDEDLKNGPKIQDFFIEKEKADDFLNHLQDSDQWTDELTVATGNDSAIHCEVVAAPNIEEDGEISGYVFSILDITDQVAAHQAREMNERNAATIATLGAACHHLSQPATVLVANSEIMDSLNDDGQNSEICELIRQNKSAADQLQQKLRELNDITLFRTEKYLQNGSINSHISNTILDIDQATENK